MFFPRFAPILVFFAANLFPANLRGAPPTVAEAKQFMDHVESEMMRLGIDAARADWVKSTYITDDTEAIAAQADERAIVASVQFVKDARRFETLALPADLERKFTLLKLGLTIATPADPALSAELTRITTSLEGTYGKGKYCPHPNDCLALDQLTHIIANDRDPAKLLDTWKGWHAIAPPMRKDFARYVALANQGAKELGFADNGAMWRSQYDMPPDAFAAEMDRLWAQVRPLYLSLHAYVRKRLREKYGDVVPASGPIPAHLLGDMWAQDWSNIYPLVAPKNADPGYDLTERLKAKNLDAKGMVRYGEGFFQSLGFAPLPETFWQRSMFVKPADREVVCHASAWDIDNADDVRLKVCLDITGEDFLTVHHELGHNFYQRAYDKQPMMFRNSANDGFHEAIGDTIALSVTPDYLVKLGLLPNAPDTSRDIGLLLHKALEKISFLPFGLLIDKWRWEVFSGRIKPEEYNASWWKMRLQYQGIAPGVARTEADFDPAAKYHIAANVPYARYFLADILQFQFHRSLAQIAGCREPLNRCSVYGSKEAGRRLNAMLEMGQSRPWQDALAELTGQRAMDARAILDYFAPLQRWLDEQNRGETMGW